MQIGMLYPYNQKKFEEEVKKGITLGADVSSLLDEINALEVKYGYDLPKVLGEIKFNCMVALGKIVLQEDKKEEDKK